MSKSSWIALAVSVVALAGQWWLGASTAQLALLGGVVAVWGVAARQVGAPALGSVADPSDEAIADVSVAAFEEPEVELIAPPVALRNAALESAADIWREASSVLSGFISDSTQDLGQARIVLRDAIENLSESFSGLKDDTASQAELVDALVEALAAQNRTGAGEDGKPGSVRAFIQEANDMLHEFVDLILTVSHESMGMVTKVEDVSRHMNSIEHFLIESKRLADRSGLLAMNAKIQAAKAGAAGRGFLVVADEIQDLARRSHKFNEEIGSTVDLAKRSIHEMTSFIGELASKDLTRTLSSKAKVDLMMETVNAANEELNQNASVVSEIAQKVHVHVGAAITALQFEDIVRQIIERADRLLGDVRAFLDDTDSYVADLRSVDPIDSDASASILLALEERVAEFRGLRKRSEVKIVTQESMAEGGVDLF